jgi:hypothetical protein
VPADRRAELEAELAPVFELFQPTAELVRELRQQAEQDAAGIRSQAEAAGRQLAEDARSEAPTERAAAMAARLADVEIEKEEIMATGRA